MKTRILWIGLVLLLGGAGAGRAAERALVVDRAQSRVEVVVKATVDSFTGKLNAFEPAITVGDDGRVVAARVAFRFRDLATGKEKRDAAMHTWQQTDQFPDGSFVLNSLEPVPAPGGGWVAVGRLTLHGVARELRFPISVMREGARTVIDGEATLDTREFGLPIIRMMAILKVDPIVKVRFHLTGEPAA